MVVKMQIDEALAFYQNKFQLLNSWFLEPGKKIVLPGTADRICRFCGGRPPDVTYRMEAHAIPESLGNKSLSTEYECDACNASFGGGIENDFGNWSKPTRTFARIRGKSGVPTLKKGSSGGWRIEYGAAGFQISEYEDDPICEVDQNSKLITFRLKRDPYTPVAVLKAFVKMGLSLIPAAELHNFQSALSWIKQSDHGIGLVQDFPILYSFIPGPLPNDKIAVMTFRRKDGCEEVPYAFFVLGYGNEVFQVFLPSPERDLAIQGRQLTLYHFPTPYGEDPSKYGPVRRGQLNLTGREIVKGQVASIVVGFDHATRTEPQVD
jgi:hypothetical protein